MFHCPQQRRKEEDRPSQSLSLHEFPYNILGRGSSFCFLLGSFCSLLTFVPRVEVVHFLLEEMYSFIGISYGGCYFFRDVPDALASEDLCRRHCRKSCFLKLPL